MLVKGHVATGTCHTIISRDKYRGSPKGYEDFLVDILRGPGFRLHVFHGMQSYHVTRDRLEGNTRRASGLAPEGAGSEPPRQQGYSRWQALMTLLHTAETVFKKIVADGAIRPGVT